MARLSESGLTLTEVTVVTILAVIVMLGLVGFYLSSQGTWVDTSSQVITQREATTVMENIAERVHHAGRAEVGSGSHLELFDEADTTLYAFWWDTSDSSIHEGPDLATDRGASMTSTVEQFACTRNDSLVSVSLGLRSAQGMRFRVSSQFEMINRDRP